MRADVRPSPASPPERPGQGLFLLTFDCEGKWGIADCLARRHRRLFTTAALEQTYERLVRMLDRYELPATFAFTVAFAMGKRSFARLRPDLAALRGGMDPWLAQALAGVDADGGDGWFAPRCLDSVLRPGRHEIASHGFTHMAWCAPYATREVLATELSLARQVDGFGREQVSTFVYPRNQVAHTDLLAEHGYLAYRAPRPTRSRLMRLLQEFDAKTPSDPPHRPDGPAFAVPAGHFINWRHGLRRCVPASLTLRRWEHLVDHAVRSGGVVHAWTHPENFIDGTGMFPLMDRILARVARARDSGRLRVLTVAQYAARLHPPQPIAEPALATTQGKP